VSISQEKILNRQNKLRHSLQSAGLNAIALNPGPSLYYLSGLNFHLSERPVVVIFPAQGSPIIVLPELEIAKIQNLTIPISGFPYSEDPSLWVNVFEEAIQTLNLPDLNIGVEPRVMRILELNLLELAAPKAKFIPAGDVVAGLRMIKDEDEIISMKKAVRIAEDALAATLPSIKIGKSEREIASELTMQLFIHGSDPHLPFFPIVSSGPNSANPHASPSKRKLALGDMLVIDFGANFNGYFSDITRTFAIGSIENDFKTIYETVLAANQAGHSEAKIGTQLGKIDKAARDVINFAGFGNYFIHRTGHGLGLEGHEEPYIRSDNENIIEIGMSFTIEPGIYIPNQGGVRIEDDVIITKDGCQSLTTFPKKLTILD
jgi:Xaa-Pro dipeptidase